MPNIVYIAASLDGCIARKDGNLDWLTSIPNPQNSDFGFSDFMERIDGILMGRKTFEFVLGFNEWPYTKPVFVLSSTLKEAPDGFEEKVEIITGAPKAVTEALNEKGFYSLYIDGGKTIQGFLKENLIDELIITRIPIVLGSGIPLFAGMDLEIQFDHAGTEVFNNMLVKSRYLRKK